MRETLAGLLSGKGKSWGEKEQLPWLERLSVSARNSPQTAHLTFARLFSKVPSNSLRSNGNHLKHRKFHYKNPISLWISLEWITQRDCGVPILLQLTLLWAGELNQMVSRGHHFQLQRFCDSLSQRSQVKEVLGRLLSKEQKLKHGLSAEG